VYSCFSFLHPHFDPLLTSQDSSISFVCVDKVYASAVQPFLNLLSAVIDTCNAIRK
jgi:hypothetical protein